MQRLWYIILLTGSVPAAHATSCANLEPCAYLRPGSAVFIGTVESVEPLPQPVMLGPTHQVKLTVKEIFAGLPEGTKEVTITGGEMRAGKEYLIDGWRNSDGKVSTGICGNTGEVDESSPYLRYLQLRQKGKVSTSLTVWVYGATIMSWIGIPEAEVLVRGPRGEIRGTTDVMGKAVFEGVAPGEYAIAASKEHYRTDGEHTQEGKIQVLDQACPSSSMFLRTDSVVSGVLRMPDGTGVRGVGLDLVGINPERERRGYDPGTYTTTTGESGRFHFEAVLPGRYLLGPGIRFPSIATSQVPVLYYPGRKMRAEASEILVSAGSSVEGLQFTLTGVGAPRTIRIQVIDEKGQPVAGAKIQDQSWYRKQSEGFATLGDDLRTGKDGWLEVQGYEGVRYKVGASIGNFRQGLRSSPAVEIAPGNGPLTVQLVLGPPQKLIMKKPAAP